MRSKDDEMRKGDGFFLFVWWRSCVLQLCIWFWWRRV